mgnify:FL=1
MSLVFAALSPHPPLLIPNIGKKNISKLAETKKALEKLEESLYVSYPDTILIISPHGHSFPDVFGINASPTFTTDFARFGDLATTHNFKADLPFISQITAAAKRKHFPFVLHLDPGLDYGSSVPLFYLTRHLPKVKIIPVSFSQLDHKTHMDFGYLLKEEIMKTPERVAVIASADLSHRLSDKGPGGFSPDGAKFDETVIAALKNLNSAALLNMDPQITANAAACGLRSILILLGILRHVNYDLKILSYEKPLGVGYLTAEFALK